MPCLRRGRLAASLRGVALTEDPQPLCTHTLVGGVRSSTSPNGVLAVGFAFLARICGSNFIIYGPHFIIYGPQSALRNLQCNLHLRARARTQVWPTPPAAGDGQPPAGTPPAYPAAGGGRPL